MNRLTNGGPAFPGKWYDFQPHTGDQVVREQWEGMTLRDYFAAKAMQADLSNWPEDAGDWLKHRGDLAHRYYQMADAMLAERELEARRAELDKGAA